VSKIAELPHQPSKTLAPAPKSKPISKVEQATLVNYLTGGSMETGSMLNTNWKLRGLTQEPMSEEEKEQIKQMDSALSKLPKNTKATTMYRGIDMDEETAANFLRKVQQTKTLKDEGFGSFSTDKDQAEMFTSRGGGVPVLIVSRSKEFRDVRKFAPEDQDDQQEHILPRGVTLRVDKVSKRPDGTIVVVTS
jgi:hypothetical protein